MHPSLTLTSLVNIHAPKSDSMLALDFNSHPRIQVTGHRWIRHNWFLLVAVTPTILALSDYCSRSSVSTWMQSFVWNSQCNTFLMLMSTPSVFLNSFPPSPLPVPMCISTSSQATSQTGEIVIVMNFRKLVLISSSLFSSGYHHITQVRGVWWSLLQSISKEVGSRPFFLIIWNVFVAASFFITQTLC